MKEQRFKNETLTERKCVNSILRFYSLATIGEIKDGLEWYSEANAYCRELAARFNITLQQSAGIIAAFSPQTGWLENKRYALSFLLNPASQLRSKVQQQKALTILTLKSEADIYAALSTKKKAFKTKAFFLNMLNPDLLTGCTIDRHAIASCVQSPDNTSALDRRYGDNLTAAQYDFFQVAYVKAAYSLDILPHQLQAIVWLTYRRIRQLKQDHNTNQWVPFDTDVTF